MLEIVRSVAWDGLVRIATLSVGILALAGCATGYSFVQPDTGGAGSYYTSDAAYPTPGYYYEDGVGPYDPYDAVFGYGSLYGPPFTFGLDFGSPCGWGCAGYYGGWPWYYGGAVHDWRRHRGHHRHDDPVASGISPRPWLNPDHARVPPFNGMRAAAPPIAVRERPMKELVHRRPLESVSFALQVIDRVQQPAGLPDRAAYTSPQPSAFVERPMPVRSSTQHDFARPAAPAFAPARGAPPPARSSHPASVRIP